MLEAAEDHRSLGMRACAADGSVETWRQEGQLTDNRGNRHRLVAVEMDAFQRHYKGRSLGIDEG